MENENRCPRHLSAFRSQENKRTLPELRDLNSKMSALEEKVIACFEGEDVTIEEVERVLLSAQTAIRAQTKIQF